MVLTSDHQSILMIMLIVVMCAPISAHSPCFVDRVEPSGGVLFGSFGREVAIDADTAVVGAPGVGTTVGSAHIFTFNGGNWTESQELQPSDPEPGLGFGRSVDIHNDLAIIGAKRSAYVFRFSSGSWIEEQKLTAWDKPDESGFSNNAVVVFHDLIVVGDGANNEKGTFAGAAYVFRHDGKQWVPEQKLFAFDPQQSHGFGSSMAITGDMIAIAALGDSEGCQPHEQAWQCIDPCCDDEPACNDPCCQTPCEGDCWWEPCCSKEPSCNAGAIYIFRFDEKSGQWIEHQKVLPPIIEEVMVFDMALGWDLAISGETMIAGARPHAIFDAPCGATGCGIALIYTLDPETQLWGNPQILLPEQSGIRGFGRAVDIDGDYAIIGARDSGVAGFGPGSPYEGAALLYKRDTDGLWKPSAMFLPEPPWPHAFGRAVAISGNHTLIGSPLENSQQGAAYFHKIDAPGDLDCDGVVDVFDLIELINQWGPCPDPEFLYTDWMSCPADINTDGTVDGADLLILLSNWG